MSKLFLAFLLSLPGLMLLASFSYLGAIVPQDYTIMTHADSMRTAIYNSNFSASFPDDTIYHYFEGRYDHE